jgi:hypothetical protein
MSTTLREFLADAAVAASRIFEETGELLPLYHVVIGTGEEIAFPGLPGNKDVAVAAVRELFRITEATRYVFMNEAWALMSEDEKTTQEVYRDGVRNHPDRVEIIMFSAEDVNEGMLLAHRDIIREDGKVRLGPLEIQDRGTNEGRMVGLLPQRGTTQ